jgi:hypothetical protein
MVHGSYYYSLPVRYLVLYSKLLYHIYIKQDISLAESSSTSTIVIVLVIVTTTIIILLLLLLLTIIVSISIISILTSTTIFSPCLEY